MGPTGWLGLIVAAWLAVTQPAMAASPIGPASQEVEQKLVFVRQLLHRSSIPKHIIEKGTPASRKLLEEARLAYESAQEAVAANNPGKAERLLDEATRLIGRASRATPDFTHIQEQQRQRFDMLHQGLQSMLKSYDAHAARAKPSPSMKPFDRREIENGRRYALQQAEAGDIAGAGDALERLQDKLAAQLNLLIGQAVYVDKLKFETPVQEYNYEIDRFRSLADMLPMANAKFKPNAEVAGKMKALADRGMSGYVQARQMAAGKDYSGAISRLREASLIMQQVLELAGFRLQVVGE